MLIYHIAAELAPIAKVGGLGDVILGLCRQLNNQGHTAEVILPKYDCVDYSSVDHLHLAYPMVPCDWKEKTYENKVWIGYVKGLRVYFIDPQCEEEYFQRGDFYSQSDDIERFTYFSKAALAFLHFTRRSPNIVHIHDWQTSLIPALYQEIYLPLKLKIDAIVLTIHNIEYQGWCHPQDLKKAGLIQNYEDFALSKDLNSLNLLKGGIVLADAITTVSPTYANEVMTSLGGRGLESLLTASSHKFFGLLNGIDYEYWDPETDPQIPFHYSYRDRDRSGFTGKEKVKEHLQKKLRLEVSSVPLVGCITRLVPQKGLLLIKHALNYTLQIGGQFILLGSTNDPTTLNEFKAIKETFKENQSVYIELSYNEALSHLLYAASDIIIVPSLFEPCGLTQMIALRYGAVPLVRRTGGLQDTVFDIEDSEFAPQMRNGFCFKDPDPQGMEWALQRAFDLKKEDPIVWKELVFKGMKQDNSWHRSCTLYVALYQKLINAPV